MSAKGKLLVSKRKLLLAVVAIALVCSLASGSFMYVLGQGGGSHVFTISSGQYPGAPSYTIYSDGAVTPTYYAKDAYGVIAYTSTTDVGTIINNILGLGTLVDIKTPKNFS